LWSVDTMDWSSRNTYSVYNEIMDSVTDGSIVLLHDIYSTSVNGALKAMRELRNQGYVFVTVSELFRRRGITLKNGQVYTNASNKGTTLPAYKAPKVTTTLDFKERTKTISVSTADKGVTLYYTTNGSYPSMAAKKYTSKFTVPYEQTVYIVGYDKYGVRTAIYTSAPNKEYLGVFDPIYYGNRYPTLKKKYNGNEKKLFNHFVTSGLKSGLQGSPVFNVQYYAAKYPDLQNRFGGDVQKYAEHFRDYGMKSGRRGSEEFALTCYRLRYPKLREKYGDDYKEYYLHYIRYGHRHGLNANKGSKMIGYTTVYNGVDYADVYDYNFYTTRYPYIKDNYKLNDAGVLKHFVQSGLKNGHQGSADFHVHRYRHRYPDLQKKFGDDLPAYYTHYMKYGRKEGRIGN
ncbi:MAG: chitobiase/beta-hexosaminidase C-terminal domain-containing protein, partial [Clostridia bacterium]|nr:chitobiase/beta-hexosaminidase C-terminal domain-containing protein [Clostridia bacterium]